MRAPRPSASASMTRSRSSPRPPCSRPRERRGRASCRRMPRTPSMPTSRDASSGVASVSANVTAITAGQTAVPLSSVGGPWTVAGVSYAYRSADLDADDPLVEGATTWSLTALDNAGNARSTSVPGHGRRHGAGGDHLGYRPGRHHRRVRLHPPGRQLLRLRQRHRQQLGRGRGERGCQRHQRRADGRDADSSTGGPWTIGGISYAYRSAGLTADASLAEVDLAYSISAFDAVDNVDTEPFTVTVDNTAPGITGATIAPTAGTTTPGFIAQGSTFFVYANVTDATAGLSSVTADVSAIATGQTAVALTTTGGPWTVGGVSYTYRSASRHGHGRPRRGRQGMVADRHRQRRQQRQRFVQRDRRQHRPVVTASVVAPTAGTTSPGLHRPGRQLLRVRRCQRRVRRHLHAQGERLDRQHRPDGGGAHHDRRALDGGRRLLPLPQRLADRQRGPRRRRQGVHADGRRQRHQPRQCLVQRDRRQHGTQRHAPRPSLPPSAAACPASSPRAAAISCMPTPATPAPGCRASARTSRPSAPARRPWP